MESYLESISGRGQAKRYPPNHMAACGEGDDLLGDHPHEKQGRYRLYQTDQSTLNLVKSYALKIKLHEKKK